MRVWVCVWKERKRRKGVKEGEDRKGLRDWLNAITMS